MHICDSNYNDDTVEHFSLSEIPAKGVRSIDLFDARGRSDVVELFDVPNEWLPESYRTTGTHRSLASVEKQYNREQAKLAEKQVKADHEAAKARNVERYAEQFEELVERDETGTFVRMSEEFERSEVEHDDDGKYRWEMAFVKATQMEIE